MTDVTVSIRGAVRAGPIDGANAPRRWPSIIRAIVQVAVGAGLCAWLIRTGALEPSRVSRLLTAPGLVLLALAFVVGNYACLAMRLRAIVTASGVAISWIDAMRLTLASAFAGWLIPGGLGSDMTKAYLLSRGSDGGASRGIGVAVVDRLLGLIAMMLLAVVGQIAAIDQVWGNAALRRLFVACVGVLGGFSLLCCIVLWLSLRRDRSATADRAGWFQRPADSLAQVVQRPRLLARAFAWSLCAQASVVAAAVVVCAAMTDSMPDGAVCAFIPVGLVANAVPISPGGLGVGEAVFETLFKLAGTLGGAEIALSWRMLAVIGSLPGLWFLIRWSRRRKRGATGEGEPLAAA